MRVCDLTIAAAVAAAVFVSETEVGLVEVSTVVDSDAVKGCRLTTDDDMNDKDEDCDRPPNFDRTPSRNVLLIDIITMVRKCVW